MFRMSLNANIGTDMNTEPLLSEYLTEDEAASELKVCVRTLRRWRDLGQGPAITKLGRRALYRRTTVSAWLASRERATA
jgi:excisionase family DNA binding protein